MEPSIHILTLFKIRFKGGPPSTPMSPKLNLPSMLHAKSLYIFLISLINTTRTPTASTSI